MQLERKSITLHSKLVILIGIPLAAILLFVAIFAVWPAVRELRVTGAIMRTSQLGVLVSDLAHRLQVERGSSGLFLGSKGAKFKTELTQARQASDLALAALRADFDPQARTALGSSQDYLNEALRHLDALAATRSAVDSLSIPASQSFTYYTETIAHHLNFIGELATIPRDAATVRKTLAYVNLLNAKERAGQERATLANVLARGAFGEGQFVRFVDLQSQQSTYFSAYTNLALSKQVESYTQAAKSAATLKVVEYRLTALSHPTGAIPGLDSVQWFESSTRRIDELKQLEDSLALDLRAGAKLARVEAWRRLCLPLLLVALTLLAALHESRSISRWLGAIVSRLNNQSYLVEGVAGQLASGSQAIAEGATMQAASLEETGASLEEVAAMTRQNANHAQQAKDLARQTHEVADAGARSIHEMTAAMKEIQESSDSISEIIRTINEIAFQTNILALNAAVEAARAGEAGAGFAVVADEVRSLAQRSGQAASETAAKIEESMNRSRKGCTVSSDLESSFGQIVQRVREVDGIVAEIATACKEQSVALDQVNVAIAQMEKITQTSAAGAEEAASASEELKAEAGSLRALVGELSNSVVEATDRTTAPAASNKRVGATAPSPAPAAPGRKAPTKAAPKSTGKGRTTLNGAQVAAGAGGGVELFEDF